MNITIMIEDLTRIISASADSLNLVPADIKQKLYKVTDDNQFTFGSMGAMGKIKLYLIAHKDVSIIADFLRLSSETLQNLERSRKFIASITPSEFSFTHIANKIHITSDELIDVAIIGNGPTFRVSIRDSELSVYLSYGNLKHSECYRFDSYDELDSIINTAINKIIPDFLETVGFESKDEKTPEVLDFINKTAEQMFFEKGVNPLFNYIKPDELVHLVCSDLNLNLNDVIQSLHYQDTESVANLYIPNNLTTMISSIAQHLVNIDGIKYKVDQLISLIVLYNNITNKKEKFSVTFHPVQKKDFFKGHSFNRSYYVLNISETLTIYIGHKLGNSDQDEIAYVDDRDDFKLFSFVYLKDLVNHDYDEYLTNDIDYVYNAILTDLRSIIKKVLCKEDDTISFRDLEVYKMAVF